MSVVLSDWAELSVQNLNWNLIIISNIISSHTCFCTCSSTKQVLAYITTLWPPYLYVSLFLYLLYGTKYKKLNKQETPVNLPKQHKYKMAYIIIFIYAYLRWVCFSIMTTSQIQALVGTGFFNPLRLYFLSKTVCTHNAYKSSFSLRILCKLNFLQINSNLNVNRPHKSRVHMSVYFTSQMILKTSKEKQSHSSLWNYMPPTKNSAFKLWNCSD